MDVDNGSGLLLNLLDATKHTLSMLVSLTAAYVLFLSEVVGVSTEE